MSRVQGEFDFSVHHPFKCRFKCLSVHNRLYGARIKASVLLLLLE